MYKYACKYNTYMHIVIVCQFFSMSNLSIVVVPWVPNYSFCLVHILPVHKKSASLILKSFVFIRFKIVKI
jgi:hypothetical protein